MSGVTEDEAALYDRQIRLWGLEAQNHMRRAHVVLVSFTGAAQEVAKNIVLAGIGRLTVLDGSVVSEEDLSAALFFRDSDVGQARIAEAPLDRLRRLNPHVQVSGEAHDGVPSTETFGALQADMVLVTQGDRADLIAWNDLCRAHGAMFVATAVYGLSGYVFCDLGTLEYVQDRPVPGTSDKIAVKYKQTFVPLKESLEAPWTFRPSAGLVAAWALWTAIERASDEALNDPTLFQSSLQEASSSLIAAKGANEASVFRRIDAAAFYKAYASATCPRGRHIPTYAFAPTSAIVGGIVAQSMLNALGRREEPIVNWCIVDAAHGTADVHACGAPPREAL